MGSIGDIYDFGSTSAAASFKLAQSTFEGFFKALGSAEVVDPT